MHRTNTLFAFIVACCLTAFAYAQSSDKQPSPGPNPDSSDARGQGMGRSDQDTAARGGATGDRAMQAGSRINVQIDQQFEQDWIKHAMSGNQFEVQLGQLVSGKSQDPSVKQLAQRLVQDHQKAADQLKQVAQQMNVPVSDELMPAHRAKLEAFQQKQGQMLDLAFVFCAIGDHTQGTLEYQFVAQNTPSPQLKQYASQTLPHLVDHLQMARRLSPVSMGEARTAGERMGPSGGSDTGTGTGHRDGNQDRDR
jgi:predicted outer membrane protein